MNELLAGFGRSTFTPTEPLPLASYGDDLRRFSQGKLSELEALALAITDARGDTLILATGDLSWCPGDLGDAVKAAVTEKLGIPGDHIVLSGIHTHDSVATHHTHLPEILRFREVYITAMVEAICEAFADRKPGRVYGGSAITERMNFVRRYIMDDGSLRGDNAPGTGKTLAGHESAADPELQLVSLVREGAQDILLTNFQAHPHIEGKKSLVSSQAIGAFRREAESRFGCRCIHWNGGAGNLNSHSRIDEENRTREEKVWASLMADYAESALPALVPLKTGPIRVADTTFTARVNHLYDGITDKAQQVVDYFNDGHTPVETAPFAQSLGMNSLYHAQRILANAKAPQTKDMYLFAWSCGDLGGVVLPYELFDSTCMHIKRNSPLRKTLVQGYSWPAYCGYIPSSLGFQNGGYEADNCTFAPGTAEEMATQYLQLLHRLQG